MTSQLTPTPAAMRALKLIATLLALLPTSAWGWPGHSRASSHASPPPQFNVVPLERFREGQAQVSTLQAAAKTETFLDKMLGTNCYSRAVKELQRDCKHLDQVQKSRLALRLANCQLATQGQGTYPCSDEEPLRKCVERLPDRDNFLYIEFLTHVDSMCLFIQNQDFEKHTEFMLNQLSEGAGYASEQLARMGSHTQRLSEDAAAIKISTEDALGRLKEQKDLQLAAMEADRQHRTETAAKFADLSEQQSAALRLAEKQLELGKELEAATEGVGRKVVEGQSQLETLFGSLGEKATELAAAQASAAEAQQQLETHLKGLQHNSKGLKSAVEAVAEYQRRSDAALIKLLGRAYTLEDALFYGAGVLAAMAAGTSKATAGARLPVLGIFAGSLVAERVLVDKLHLWLEVDSAGDVVLTLPFPAWLPGPLRGGVEGPLTFNFKWMVRRVCGTLALVLIIATVAAYRDWERATYRRLEQIHEEIKAMQRKHDEEVRNYQHEILRARMEAIGRLAGGGGGAGASRETPRAAAKIQQQNMNKTTDEMLEYNEYIESIPWEGFGSPIPLPDAAARTAAAGEGAGARVGKRHLAQPQEQQQAVVHQELAIVSSQVVAKPSPAQAIQTPARRKSKNKQQQPPMTELKTTGKKTTRFASEDQMLETQQTQHARPPSARGGGHKRLASDAELGNSLCEEDVGVGVRTRRQRQSTGGSDEMQAVHPERLLGKGLGKHGLSQEENALEGPASGTAGRSKRAKS